MIAHAAYDVAARSAHAVQPHVLAAWRRLLLARARDETAPSTTRSCLVVAPHPDDETLGCGATIARKRAAGTDVKVVIVADGRHAQPGSTVVAPAELAAIRSAEAVTACRALGVADADLVQLSFEDTRVGEAVDELAESLHDVIADCSPQEILVTSRLDHHPDHRAVCRAVHTAIDRGRARISWRDAEPLVREYPVWSWIDGPWIDQRARTPAGRALHLVGEPLASLVTCRPTTVATGEHLGSKRAALAAHASQTTRMTSEPGWAVMEEPVLELFLGDVEVFFAAPPIDRRTS